VASACGSSQRAFAMYIPYGIKANVNRVTIREIEDFENY
jgi:hypothetical protein